MKVNKTLAPIVLFVYNRADHTEQTIEALKNNILAEDSNLYIYSDAAKNANAIQAVLEVRGYIKSVKGFKTVTIIQRDKNFGLAASIIDGVSVVCAKHGRVIVLEDDLVTSQYFLTYMNDALDIYKDVEKIFSITGFNFSSKFMKFPKDYKEDIYLNIRPMSWSWGTWIDRWKEVDWDVLDYQDFIKSSQKKEFNKGGPDLTRMLKKQMNGKSDSWYIRWTYNAYKKSKFTIYPKVSYVNNIGHDNSGVHCTVDENEIYSHKELNFSKIIEFNKNIKMDQRIINNFNKAFRINFPKKIKELFYKLFFNKK